MVTIEERAYKAYCGQTSCRPDNKIYEHCIHCMHDTRKDAYIKGATEQEQIDIDRVCQWLEVHLPYYCDEFDESYTAEVISDLREEMVKED